MFLQQFFKLTCTCIYTTKFTCTCLYTFSARDRERTLAHFLHVRRENYLGFREIITKQKAHKKAHLSAPQEKPLPCHTTSTAALKICATPKSIDPPTEQIDRSPCRSDPSRPGRRRSHLVLTASIPFTLHTLHSRPLQISYVRAPPWLPAPRSFPRRSSSQRRSSLRPWRWRWCLSRRRRRRLSRPGSRCPTRRSPSSSPSPSRRPPPS